MSHSHDTDMFIHVEEVAPIISSHAEHYVRTPVTVSDKIARHLVRSLAALMDFFFQTRYSHRAVVLETVAAVPGMVGGLLQHLKALRRIQDDRGWIQTLLDEAENERMHLMVYSEMAKPTAGERLGIMVVQFFFYHLYFLLYLISPSTAHRFVGYLEEEAVHSYEKYLASVEKDPTLDIPASELAISYWALNDTATLKDVIRATIKDEMLHRDVNHKFADDPKGAALWK